MRGAFLEVVAVWASSDCNGFLLALGILLPNIAVNHQKHHPKNQGPEKLGEGFESPNRCEKAGTLDPPVLIGVLKCHSPSNGHRAINQQANIKFPWLV